MMESVSKWRKLDSKIRKSGQKEKQLHVAFKEQSHASVNKCNGLDASTSQVNRSSHADEDDADALCVIAEANDVSEMGTSDKQKVGLFFIVKLAIKRRFTSFAQEASIAYMSHLVEEASSIRGTIARKILWAFLLLFGVGIMTFQFYDRIYYYLSYPTVVDYQLAYNRSLRFPAVSICPETVFSKKRVIDAYERYVGLGVKVAEAAAQAISPVYGLDLHPDYESLNASFLSFDFKKSYFAMNPTIDDYFIQCEFQKKPCDLKKDIKQMVYELLICFTFNPETSHLHSTQTGSDYGLRLVLWMNASDTLIVSSSAAGFKVLLHHPSEVPPVRNLGFRISPGKSTAVSISFRNVYQLPAPYGDCCDENGYTSMQCYANCFYEYFWTQCNCSIDISGDSETRPSCNPLQYAECYNPAVMSFFSTKASHDCNCPLECNQRVYPYTVSFSSLSQHYLNLISKRLDFRGRNIDVSKLSKDLYFVDIFYSKLTYENIQTKPAYNALKLFADLGGSLGLILGGTVLTVFEVFQFVFDLVTDVVGSFSFARRVKSSRSPISGRV